MSIFMKGMSNLYIMTKTVIKKVLSPIGDIMWVRLMMGMVKNHLVQNPSLVLTIKPWITKELDKTLTQARYKPQQQEDRITIVIQTPHKCITKNVLQQVAVSVQQAKQLLIEVPKGSKEEIKCTNTQS
jgi:hypothetical protein